MTDTRLERSFLSHMCCVLFSNLLLSGELSFGNRVSPPRFAQPVDLKLSPALRQASVAGFV